MNRFRILASVLLALVTSSPARVVAPTERGQERAQERTQENGHIAYADARSYYEARVNLAEPEQARIRKHLATVEDDMRRHPPAGLGDAQRARRLALLDTLHVYRERGEFPRNRDFPDRLIPYFIDAADVPCAMGKLIIASGHADLAEDVRATMNNAYIAEIAAADGRLAAWGHAHGITLEEAARIQPAYGPPSLAQVMRIASDSRGRLWVTGPDQNALGAYDVGVRDSGQWFLAHTNFGIGPPFGFCLSGDGRALIAAGGYELTWPLTADAPSPRPSPFGAFGLTSCAWQAGDSLAWAGGSRGLLRLERASGDSLAIRDSFPTPPGLSDTVTAVAVASGRVWVGTKRGAYARTLSGPGTITTWDADALGGQAVTGLKTGGNTVWLGIDGENFGGGMVRFSSRGLRRIVGDSVRTFRAAMSSVMVPGDTIHALAVRDSASVWLATSTGFYHFSGTAGTPKVADLPAPGLIINDMTGDANGFYAATAQGVYEFRNGTLTFIGSPVVSLRSGPSLQVRDKAMVKTLVHGLKGTRSGDPAAVTILGRRAGTEQAAGVFVTPQGGRGRESREGNGTAAPER